MVQRAGGHDEARQRRVTWFTNRPQEQRQKALYIICYMLYIVYYMLCIVYYILYIVCYVLYVICYMLYFVLYFVLTQFFAITQSIFMLHCVPHEMRIFNHRFGSLNDTLDKTKHF